MENLFNDAEHKFIEIVLTVVITSILTMARNRTFSFLKLLGEKKFTKYVRSLAKREAQSTIDFSFLTIMIIGLVLLVSLNKFKKESLSLKSENSSWVQIYDTLDIRLQENRLKFDTYDEEVFDVKKELGLVEVDSTDKVSAVKIYNDKIKLGKSMSQSKITIIILTFFQLFSMVSLTYLIWEYLIGIERKRDIADFDWKISILSSSLESNQINKLITAWSLMESRKDYNDVKKRINEHLNEFGFTKLIEGRLSKK